MLTYKKRIKKFIQEAHTKPAFEFWILIILYSIVVFLLVWTKREPSELIIGCIIIFSSFLASYLIVNFYILPISNQNQKKEWLKQYLTFKKKSNLIDKVHFLCKISLLFFMVGFLLLLFKLDSRLISFFFTIQIIFGGYVFISLIYLFKYHKLLFKHEWIKWAVTGLFTLISLLFGLFCQALSREIITSWISVLPEQLPTVTKSVYYFLFILCVSYLIQIMAVSLSGKNKATNAFIILITISVCISSVTLVNTLIINSGEIINYLVSKTYPADTLPYFRCDNVEKKVNELNDTARYIKIEQGVYRIIFIENHHVKAKTLNCNKNEYIISEIYN